MNKPWVTEASEFVTEKAFQETTLRLFPRHTLIIALYGEGKTRGKVSELAIKLATINQALAALVLANAASACLQYLKVFLLSNYEAPRCQSAGGMQPNLNLGLVKKIVVPLPPATEQEQIVGEVEERLSVVDGVESQIEADLQRRSAPAGDSQARLRGPVGAAGPGRRAGVVLLARIRASREAECGHPLHRRAVPQRGRCEEGAAGEERPVNLAALQASSPRASWSAPGVQEIDRRPERRPGDDLRISERAGREGAVRRHPGRPHPGTGDQRQHVAGSCPGNPAPGTPRDTLADPRAGRGHALSAGVGDDRPFPGSLHLQRPAVPPYWQHNVPDAASGV